MVVRREFDVNIKYAFLASRIFQKICFALYLREQGPCYSSGVFCRQLSSPQPTGLQYEAIKKVEPDQVAEALVIAALLASETFGIGLLVINVPLPLVFHQKGFAAHRSTTK